MDLFSRLYAEIASVGRRVINVSQVDVFDVEVLF